MAHHMNSIFYHGTPDEMLTVVALLVVFSATGVVEIRAAEPANRPGVRGVGMVIAFNLDRLANGGRRI